MSQFDAGAVALKLFGRQLGKSTDGENRARAALRSGQQVIFARKDGSRDLVTLAADGETLVFKPLDEKPAPTISFDEMIDSLSSAAASEQVGDIPCDTGAREAAPGVQTPDRRP